MTIADYAKQVPNEFVGAVRGVIIFTAIVGIAMGVIILVWPKATLWVIAVLFSIALIVAGLFRLYQAFASTFLSGAWRFVIGLIGALILYAGIVALFNPEDSLLFLAIFIGIGWIFQGVGDLASAANGSRHSPTWLLVLSGMVSIIAGIVMMWIPELGLEAFIWVSAILLIVLSVASLLTLPKKVDTQPATV